MNRNGMSTAELLVTLAAFTAVATGIMLAGRAGMNASTTTDYVVQQSANARNALTALSNDLAASNISTITSLPCKCTSADNCECLGDKITFKVPIIDDTPVANSMYTPDGKIKFGAKDPVSGKEKQNCRYQYMVNKQNQLVKKSLCVEDISKICGDGRCDKSTPNPESVSTCPVDCTYCGDEICSALSGENTSNCVDCVTCGDAYCSPGENCGEAKQCEYDCGVCAGSANGSMLYCGNGQCGTGETCLNCAADCGACPIACGQYGCQAGETCVTCPGDCGACPPPGGPVCGNGICEGLEAACGKTYCFVDCPPECIVW